MDITVIEGTEAQLQVVLTGQPTEAVTVSVSGAAGSDLTVSGFPLTFTADNWDTAQSVTITAREDNNTVDEAAVTLTLTAAGGAEYAGISTVVVVTVHDNDSMEARLSSLSLSGISVPFAIGTETYSVDVPVEVLETTVSAAITNPRGTLVITPDDADGTAAGRQVEPRLWSEHHQGRGHGPGRDDHEDLHGDGQQG